MAIVSSVSKRSQSAHRMHLHENAEDAAAFKDIPPYPWHQLHDGAPPIMIENRRCPARVNHPCCSVSPRPGTSKHSASSLTNSSALPQTMDPGAGWNSSPSSTVRLRKAHACTWQPRRPRMPICPCKCICLGCCQRPERPMERLSRR